MTFKRLLLIFFVAGFSFSCNKKSNGGAVPTPTPTPTPNPSINPATLSLPVTGAQVRASISYTGIANVHPRLLYTNTELNSIKLAAQTDLFAKPTYDDIIIRANALLSSSILDYGLDGAGLRITNIHTICNDQIPYLVLAYQFTGDTRYALRCWQQLDRMCSYPDWGANRHFLDAGIAAKGVALALDGLHGYLTAAQRDRLYSAVKSFVLQPGKTQIETGTGAWKWYQSTNNWNGICHGGMIMASLAAYEMDSVFLGNVIALAANNMMGYIQTLNPDGASEEGMSYWSYGLSNTYLALEAMKRVIGGTYGLTNVEGLRKTGAFPYLVSGPVGTATFGDDYLYVGKNNRFLSHFWFSKFYQDPVMAKTHYDRCLSINSNRTVKMNSWTDLLFYDRSLVNQGSSMTIPTYGYVKGVEYGYLFENTSDETSLYAGIHAGNNNASHGHLDAGSFFIQALGETWAQGNLGLETPYPSDYFTLTQPSYNDAPTTSATNRGRFYYYRVRTEAKNCLVFNPDARPEQNPAGVATVSNQANDNAGGFFILNMTSPYSRDVSAYKRGIKLNRIRQTIMVQDEFTPGSNSTVYWIMQSPATDGAQISTDGKTLTMLKNGKTFYARLVSPSNASFTVVDRSTTSINYLSETLPIFSSIMAGKNSINTWYGKVQVKMTGVPAGTPVTVRIDFLPNLTTSALPISSLDSWTTVN